MTDGEKGALAVLLIVLLVAVWPQVTQFVTVVGEHFFGGAR